MTINLNTSLMINHAARVFHFLVYKYCTCARFSFHIFIFLYVAFRPLAHTDCTHGGRVEGCEEKHRDEERVVHRQWRA